MPTLSQLRDQIPPQPEGEHENQIEITETVPEEVVLRLTPEMARTLMATPLNWNQQNRQKMLKLMVTTTVIVLKTTAVLTMRLMPIPMALTSRMVKLKRLSCTRCTNLPAGL